MRTIIRLFAFWLLAFTTSVLANPFWFRQESTHLQTAPSPSSASATAAPSAGAAKASPSASGAASSGAAATAAATTGSKESAAASTGTAKGTAAATSSSSAAATSSVFLPTTPEELKCKKESEQKPEDDSSPFCFPEERQILIVDHTYNVTWDPHLFPHNSTVKIEVLPGNTTTTAKNITTETAPLGFSPPLANEKGFWPMTVHDDYLDDNGTKNETSLTLFIIANTTTSSSPDTDKDLPIIKSGPVFTLITFNKNTTSHESHKGDNKIGEKAGIPVGLGIFLIAAAGLIFWFLRRRRNRQAGYLAKRSGSLGGGRARRMTGDESSGGFRDEPTRGMELQDRDRNGRQDSWEAGWNDSASSQGGGGNNAFRDEIERQRRR
ncbi:MAG: hypothetical protein L6R41_006067 [Letrouitia leprolyta]|nr:MAG: hypothetical protein L6R41_006067 [Letrouitia leprolyta]